MDIIKKESVKVPNSLIVSGLSGISQDEEICDYLKQYGKISRIIPIVDVDSEFNTQTIFEFESGEAVEALKSILPFGRTSSSLTGVTYHVKALDSVYTSAVGTDTTHTFLSELKNIARMSGMSFEYLLKEELSRITRTLTEETQTEYSEVAQIIHTPLPPQPENSMSSSEMVTTEPNAVQSQTSTFPEANQLKFSPTTPESHSAFRTSATSPGVAETMHSFNLSPDHINTPEVQRVVVEHIVKSTEMTSHFSPQIKLRSFSGRTPCPSHEVDYETWRSTVEFYLSDSAVPQSQLIRKMVDSLLPPAAQVVKTLGPQATPSLYLNLLDSAYGTVVDGDELFAKFLNTHQNTGERPSSYLHRLQSSLNEVVKKKVVSDSDADRQLLKQFCRGCWNDALITALQLEQRQNNPPTFPEFLLLLRTEEDKQSAKAVRMKQHLGFSKTKVQANSVCTSNMDDLDQQRQDNGTPSIMEQIQKQIASMQAQIAALSAFKEDKSAKPKASKSSKTKPYPKSSASDQQASSRPKPGYCFKCGEDGHVATNCSNAPNAALVDAKRKELRERQKEWDKENASKDTSLSNLNE